MVSDRTQTDTLRTQTDTVPDSKNGVIRRKTQGGRPADITEHSCNPFNMNHLEHLLGVKGGRGGVPGHVRTKGRKGSYRCAPYRRKPRRVVAGGFGRFEGAWGGLGCGTVWVAGLCPQRHAAARYRHGTTRFRPAGLAVDTERLTIDGSDSRGRAAGRINFNRRVA